MSYDSKISSIFNLHELSPDETEKCRVIRDKLRNVAELIYDACPDSREKSLAITHLDEASMFAVAAIARQNPIKEESK